MLWFPCSLALLALVSQAGASPAGRRAGRPTYKSYPDRANAVKAAFQKGWDGYYKYAFPHDSLRPVSNSYDDDR